MAASPTVRRSEITAGFVDAPPVKGAAVNRSTNELSKREPCLEFFTSIGRRRVPSLCRSVSPLFVLMAFNVFVLDYGMLWVARGQAQNAADAGALAGAVARGFDDFADPPTIQTALRRRSRKALRRPTASGGSRPHQS